MLKQDERRQRAWQRARRRRRQSTANTTVTAATFAITYAATIGRSEAQDTRLSALSIDHEDVDATCARSARMGAPPVVQIDDRHRLIPSAPFPPTGWIRWSSMITGAGPTMCAKKRRRMS